MIKLIATDLDNTLLDEHSRIPKSTAALLRQAGERGVLTAVATGRCYPSALEAAHTIGAGTPIICYNGSLIKRGDTGEELFRAEIDPDTIRQVSEYCHQNGLYLQCYDYDDVLIIEEMCRGAEIDPDLKTVGYRAVGDLRKFAGLHPTPKMLIVEEVDKVPARLKDLAETFPQLSFCQSQPWLIEVMPPNAGKGKALAHLAGLMGVEQAEVMALGDNTNDLPMLIWAGLGVVVANGVAEAKARADYVCQKERSEGVEEALKKFVL